LEPSNYADWNAPLHRWDTVAEFTSQPHWLDGIHVVKLPNGNHLDVLLQSNPLSPARRDSVAVFFSGALPNRAGKYGPYFSGARVARSLDVPFMAFSDPSLNLDGAFPLGWYAGSQNDDCQNAITEILESAAAKSGRHLLLVGGSGGGYASLYFAHRVGHVASAFVWNPQTSIIDYDIGAVRQYFDVAVPGNDFEYLNQAARARTVEKLAERGIDSVLPPSNAGRVLYLQNSTDWHVAKHLKPYLDRNKYVYRGNGYYSNHLGHSVVVSNFGTGHAVPPTELILASLRQMLVPGRSTRAIYNELIKSSLLASDFHELPRDMRTEWSGPTAPFGLDIQKNSGRWVASVNWGRYRPGAGGIKVAFNVFDVNSRIQSSQLSTDYTLAIDSPENAVRVEVIFVDGFDHRLGVISTQMNANLRASSGTSPTNTADTHQVAASGPFPSVSGESIENPNPRIFAYGSCVSRDAFQEPDAPTLVDFLARSCLGSAFSAPSGRLETISLESNPSAFQRRMVRTDLNKELEGLISSSAFDVLLVDFIDERLQLIRSASGYDTYSPELSRTGFVADPQSLVEPGSDEYMVAFKTGWKRLLELVPAEKIVINRVFWATHDESGRELTEFPTISRNNEILSQLYNYVCSNPSVQVIDYGTDEMKADPDHKWGLSPFHFSKNFYRKTIDSLTALLAIDDQDAERSRVAPTTTVLLETLFCDYERSVAVLERLAARFLHSLRSVAAQRIDPSIDLRYIIYVSSDKTVAREIFAGLIRSFPEEVANRFCLVSYDHPEAGYGYTEGDHVDLFKNPNKHAPRRDRLFELALKELSEIRSPQIIRIGLDDDDILQPWQVSEVVRIAAAANAAFPSDEMLVVGLQNSYVGYVNDPIEVDEVQFSRIMSGNKFILGPTAKLAILKNCSPWLIPEVFNENARDRMQRAGLFMVQTSDNQPGYVYMRWGDNLPQTRKDVYYEKVHATHRLREIDEIHRLPEPRRQVQAPTFSIRPREFEIVATRLDDNVVEVVSNLMSMPGSESLSYSVQLMDGTEIAASRTGCLVPSVRIEGVQSSGIYAKAILFRDGKAVSTTRSRGML
jgi:hypothetical protein